MYPELNDLSERPSVYSAYTASELWTDPHIAMRMLETHLSQSTDRASRPIEAIDRVVDWIDKSFGLNGRAICDLGCGPGLYSHRYAERGATVCGIDFSPSSIEYAKSLVPPKSGTVTYRIANYLSDPLPEKQDLVTLIYCDLCPLSPAQRQTLLNKVRQALSPGGMFIFDVLSLSAFKFVTERVLFGRNLSNGFWSANDYFAFQHTFRYDAEAVSLDRFTIFESERTRKIYNWQQYFSHESVRDELERAGFENIEFVGGFGADPSDEATFGIVAYV